MLGRLSDAAGIAETLHGMIKPERHSESSEGEMSGEHLGTLLRQVW
jgi:hypothetical protein